MKVKCSNCGEKTEWEQEEDYEPCEYCGSSGIDEIGNNCIICKGTGFVDINEDDMPICEECEANDYYGVSKYGESSY